MSMQGNYVNLHIVYFYCTFCLSNRSNEDETPLHHLGSVEIGKLLLEHGALVCPPHSSKGYYVSLSLYMKLEAPCISVTSYSDS